MARKMWSDVFSLITLVVISISSFSVWFIHIVFQNADDNWLMHMTWISAGTMIAGTFILAFIRYLRDDYLEQFTANQHAPTGFNKNTNYTGLRR